MPASFLYLWAVLTLFALHESIVLAKHEIDYRGYGMALVNAWLLAKVMLVADEDVVVGWWQGKTILESIPRLGRGSFADILSIGVILSVALTPFFAFRALEQALGAGVVLRLLLVPRSNLEPQDLSPT